MKEKPTHKYSSPACRIIYMNIDNVLCQSPGNTIDDSEFTDYGTF